MVLDDAVVHYADLAARHDRMRVLGGRRAVRSPASMSYTGWCMAILDTRGQIRDAGYGAHDPDVAFAQDGHTARVIPAVFEATQPFEQDRNDVASGRRTNNAAHR
jgi:hypothetical protein